ncbi:HPr family phosphocarrier protein [Brevibacillus migulae]|uniref:HPr family phosphocarrier protein n=1 Tax=Brevibacillus migulae TaxID=1644114 RepID=UPI00106E2E5C|nr:HPr family phosphocarrier protein [Brevibacillus migulae]
MRIEKELIVHRADGLHARPAGEIAKTMRTFQSSVEMEYGGKTINAKSIVSLMTLVAKQGAMLRVIIDGEDAQEALVALELMLR